MKILILGIDGYLGWALRTYLENRGHIVDGVDNFSRRDKVWEMGSDSLIPLYERRVHRLDITNYEALENRLTEFKPDVIVHLAEQPSAPYSMMDVHRAVATQQNNVIGTLNLMWAVKAVCPDAHIIKLGTMGEYGTPNITIPEGFFEIEYRGRRDTLPFPKQPGSFYHLSKVHDSNNLMMASRWWGLKVTDLNQGVVYGHINETRFDYDQCFGTVINRFLTQALIEHPLTVYGEGKQRRAFINIKDTMKCIELAMKNPPTGYRVFNQFTETFSVMELAKKVSSLTGVPLQLIENPRKEMAEHFYEVDNSGLLALGLQPEKLDDELPLLWEALQPFRNNVIKEVILPTVKW